MNITTEEKILLAAKKLFFEKGFEGAKMQEIANEAGINKAMLHYYYRSKELLYERVNLSFASVIIPRINSLVDMNLGIFETIENFVTIYVDFLLENPDLPGYFISEMNRNPEKFIKILSDQNLQPNFFAFIQKIAAAVEKKEIRPINPIHLIINIMSMCIFPMLAKPMILFASKMDTQSFDAVLAQRKIEIVQFIHYSIKFPNDK